MAFPYEVMLSHSYFLEHTDTFYDFYWSTMVAPKAKPNAAHLALANYEKAGHTIVILTQNIDGLHQDAGSKRVYELHGSTRRYFCTGCQKFYDLLDQLEPQRGAALQGMRGDPQAGRRPL
jgi:NAD-dependent deacetylase